MTDAEAWVWFASAFATGTYSATPDIAAKRADQLLLEYKRRFPDPPKE